MLATLGSWQFQTRTFCSLATEILSAYGNHWLNTSLPHHSSDPPGLRISKLAATTLREAMLATAANNLTIVMTVNVGSLDRMKQQRDWFGLYRGLDIRCQLTQLMPACIIFQHLSFISSRKCKAESPSRVHRKSEIIGSQGNHQYASQPSAPRSKDVCRSVTLSVLTGFFRIWCCHQISSATLP